MKRETLCNQLRRPRRVEKLQVHCHRCREPGYEPILLNTIGVLYMHRTTVFGNWHAKTVEIVALHLRVKTHGVQKIAILSRMDTHLRHLTSVDSISDVSNDAFSSTNGGTSRIQLQSPHTIAPLYRRQRIIQFRGEVLQGCILRVPHNQLFLQVWHYSGSSISRRTFNSIFDLHVTRS